MIGVLVLGETMSSTAWIGLVAVVTGVASMTLPARKPLGLVPASGKAHV